MPGEASAGAFFQKKCLARPVRPGQRNPVRVLTKPWSMSQKSVHVGVRILQSERSGAAPRHSRKRHRNTERESAQTAHSRDRSRDLWYAKLPFDHSAKRLISYQLPLFPTFMVYRPQSDTRKYPSTRQSRIRDCNSPLRIHILQYSPSIPEDCSPLGRF